MKCKDCSYWASYGTNEGECGLSDDIMPESLIRCQVYEKQSKFSYKAINSKKYNAVLVTDKEFGCLFFEEEE